MSGDSNLTPDGVRVRIGFPWWLRPFLMRGVDGITIGRRVYISREDEILLRHELAHVKQIVENGVLRFYWRYLVEYLRGRRAGMSSAEAYRHISFEVEAVAAEKLVTGNRSFGAAVARATGSIARSDDEAMRDIVEEERQSERARPARNPKG